MSAVLAQLHWREPLWLLLVLLPWLALTWRRRPPADDRLRNFADPPLWQWLLIGDQRRPLRAAAIAAWMLASLAAAGPYWQPDMAAAGEQRGADVVVIVDISPSMAAADVSPTRLERVKRELRDFTAQLGSDRLGLVAFSANAYTMLPLTTDRDAFLHFVDLLDPSLTQFPGSNPARAFEVAGNLLHDSAPDSRALVLLSDGEYHDPNTIAAARQLAAERLPLFVIGVGTAGGAPVPDEQGHFLRYQGQTVISRLDRRELQRIAAAAHGAYFDLSDEDSEWRAILTQLRERTRAAAHAAPPALTGVALYPWLLAASLALFLWSGLRRRENLALWLLPILFMAHPGSGEAAPWSAQRAYDALQRGDYARAEQLYGGQNSYSGQLGLGVAAYRRGDWRTALTAFEHAALRAADEQQKARALYNTGNALAQLHRFEDAGKRYRAALRLQPDFAKAALNLSLVNRFLDAHNGEQPSKDPQRPPSPQAGPARADADALDRRRRGQDRSAAAQGEAREVSPRAAQAGSRMGQRAGGREAPQDSEDANLQQALALWKDSAARGGGTPELESLSDDSSQLLRYRFMLDDRGPKVVIVEDKPW
jgi:Ca-activated chloride channel family protein